MLLGEGLLVQPPLQLRPLELALEPIALLLDRVDGLLHRELPGDLGRRELRGQSRDLGVLRGGRLGHGGCGALLREAGIRIPRLEAAGELVALLLHRVDRLADGEPRGDLAGLQLRREPLELGALLRGLLLEPGGQLRLGELDGRRLLPLGELEARVQLGVELRGADLADDVRVAGLVDRERLATVRAGDLVHAAILPGTADAARSSPHAPQYFARYAGLIRWMVPAYRAKYCGRGEG